MNESFQIIVAGVGSAKFVRKENEDSDESELGISHIELVEVKIRLFSEIFCRLLPLACVRTTGKRSSIFMEARQHGWIFEWRATLSYSRIVYELVSLWMIHLSRSVIVHVTHHLDRLSSRMILLPNVAEIPSCDVHHGSNVSFERFHHGFGFLSENERLIQ